MNSGLDTIAGVQETSGYEIMDRSSVCLFVFKTPIILEKKFFLHVVFWCSSQLFYCHNRVYQKS